MLLLKGLIVWRRNGIQIIEILGEVGGPTAVESGHDVFLRLYGPLFLRSGDESVENCSQVS